MFRTWIAVAAGVLIGAVTLGLNGAVGTRLELEAAKAVETRVLTAQAAFPSLDRLRGIDTTNETVALAREDQFADIFAKSGDDARRLAFDAVQSRNARLAQAGRKADLVAVVDASGVIVARDLNPNLYGDDLKVKYPSVGRALSGVANKDIWLYNGNMYRVAAAPIRARSGSIAGALIIGYSASAADAQLDKMRLGTDVAYFMNSKVEASSFASEGGNRVMDQALAPKLFGEEKIDERTNKGELTKTFRIKLLDKVYVGAAGPLAANFTEKSNSGFVVLASLSEATAHVAAVKMWLLGSGIFALLVAVGASLLMARTYLSALDRIELGVAEVIAGRREFTFESPSRDFEGLANALNTMMARLLGRPDPDSEGGGRWGGDLAVEEAATTGPQPSPQARALAEEPEAEYLQRVFKEYLEARRQTGEGVEGLTLEGFTAKLQSQETALKKKYNAQSVRFRVVVKDNQTTLKPVPITG